MAALSAPHWEAVPAETRRILDAVGALPDLRAFYLAGGTGLALRLGHRLSQDLDLFASLEGLDEALRQRIPLALQQTHALTILQDSPLGLVIEVDQVAVGLFTYGYPLLAPTETVNHVRVAGLLDIGLMKVDAIAGRGLRKDFYDVFFIAQQIALERLFQASAEKYPHARGFGMRVLSALVDFDVADRQDDPILLASAPWDEVKAFFVSEARRLGQAWFGRTNDKA